MRFTGIAATAVAVSEYLMASAVVLDDRVHACTQTALGAHHRRRAALLPEHVAGAV